MAVDRETARCQRGERLAGANDVPGRPEELEVLVLVWPWERDGGDAGPLGLSDSLTRRFHRGEQLGLRLLAIPEPVCRPDPDQPPS